MSDWHNQIKRSDKLSWNDLFHYGVQKYVGRKVPEGTVYFRRRSKRKLRTRYLVCRVGPDGELHITNTEIRYRKSKKAWGVFIDDEAVAHYRTLRAAKLAVMPGVLDRMGAEGDRCLDPPCSEPSSKIAD